MTTPKLLSDAELKEIEAHWKAQHSNDSGIEMRAIGRLLADRAALTPVPMEVETVCKFLTAVAGGANAQKCGHDVIFNKVAYLLRDLQSALAKANGELNGARAALEKAQTVIKWIAATDDEENEWDGTERFHAVRDVARAAALHPNSEGQNR